MEEIRQILAGLDWSPLFISIKTGIAATIVSFFLGIWAARKVLPGRSGGMLLFRSGRHDVGRYTDTGRI